MRRLTYVRHRFTAASIRPHWPRRTIRLRLTLLYGALFLVSAAGLLAVTYVLVSHSTGDFVITSSGSGPVSPGPDGPAIIGDASGTAGSQPIQVNGVKQLTPQQVQEQTTRFQLLSSRQHKDDLRQLVRDSGLALAIMAMLSIALGWLVAGRVLRPLRIITSAARDISASSLHERLALDGPDDELKELGDTFDGLLARLERSFQSQRQFVANASHELRTPLARQRTVVQVALADPDATFESLRAAHERVLVSGEEQERLIESLLTLTRVQAGLGRREQFDLATVAADALQARLAEAELRGLRVDAALAAAPMWGNPRLVERLVANLLDNSLRHNGPHGRIEVVTATRDRHATISVVNTGPVVAATDIDRLFQPFQRLGGERTGGREGLGLGLSIVESIANAHDAALSALPRPDGGLEIEVSFPPQV
jgi:signal transduction histidine kinase